MPVCLVYESVFSCKLMICALLYPYVMLQLKKNQYSQTLLRIIINWGDFKNPSAQVLPQAHYISL